MPSPPHPHLQHRSYHTATISCPSTPPPPPTPPGLGCLPLVIAFSCIVKYREGVVCDSFCLPGPEILPSQVGNGEDCKSDIHPLRLLRRSRACPSPPVLKIRACSHMLTLRLGMSGLIGQPYPTFRNPSAPCRSGHARGRLWKTQRDCSSSGGS